MQANHELIEYAMNSIKAYERSKDGDLLIAARVALSQCSSEMKHKVMIPSEKQPSRRKKKRLGKRISPKRGFEKRLRNAVEASGNSQSEICRRADIQTSSLYKYMNPGDSNPSSTTLRRIAKALNITEKSLMG